MQLGQQVVVLDLKITIPIIIELKSNIKCKPTVCGIAIDVNDHFRPVISAIM